MSIKCLLEYFYKGDKLECDKCPIQDGCKSQHKEEESVRQDN